MGKIITTLQDLIDMKKLEGLRLIAGRDGLSREVNTCCILDYEYDPELKNRFSYTNFKPGMLILTSFMYAKDREYLINDAVRQMIATGISGLAIKNVYRLKIQDSVLRYADSRSFPIFMIDNHGLFIELIISSVHEGIRIRKNLNYHREVLDAILHLPLGAEQETRRAYEFFPAIGRYYLAYYFYVKEPLPPETWSKANAIIRESYGRMCYQYNRGVLLLCTIETPDDASIAAKYGSVVQALRDVLPPCCVGVSDIHHSPVELRDAIEECTRAAMVAKDTEQIRYADIGSYQALFSAVTDTRMQAFCKRVLYPIFDFDAQHGRKLQVTVFGLVEHNGDLHELSKQLGQHENTIRQRLAKVASLTGLDFRKPEQYEQLALAIRIYNCMGWYREFDSAL